MTPSARLLRPLLRKRAAATHSRRSTWSRLHRWVGLGVGAWFALLGATGSVLVYEDPLDRWLNPDLLVDARRGTRLGADQILAAAQARFPRAKIEQLRLPWAPGDVYRLRLREDGSLRVGSPRIEATFSPVTGELLGTRHAQSLGVDRTRILYTVYDLHKRAMLGTTGTDLVGAVGILFLTAVAMGIYLALPRSRSGWKRVVAIKRKAVITRIAFDIHRSTGFLFALLLLLSISTGITLVYPDYARDAVSLFSKVAPFPTVPWRIRGGAPAPAFAAIVSRVQEAYPRDRITEIRFPARSLSGYLFFLRRDADVHRLGDTLVWVDPGSGEILLERGDETRTAGEAFMHWLFPLHSGTAFGSPGKIITCAAGTVPSILLVSGIYVWLKKRRAARSEKRRRAGAQPQNPPLG